MNLRDLFPKQFAEVVEKIEEAGYRVTEPGKICLTLEEELRSFIDDLLRGTCCEREMSDIIGNVIAECRLNPVLTREMIYYQKVDAAMLEYS